MRALALLFSVLACAPASAQEADPKLCNPSSYPYDAVAAAPGQHRVLFEDEHVRVLEIVLPPLAAEPVHIHALPSVIYGETGGQGGARFLYTTYRFEDGRFVPVESQEISPSAGRRAVWSPPEGPHAIANIGTVPVVFTRIEIKPEACAR
jgi:hypothetical protein